MRKTLHLKPNFKALPFEADSELIAALKINPGAVKIYMGHFAERDYFITHPYPRFHGVIELFQTDLIVMENHLPKRIRQFFICPPENKSYIFTATAKIQAFRDDEMDFHIKLEEFGTCSEMRELFLKYGIR